MKRPIHRGHAGAFVALPSIFSVFAVVAACSSSGGEAAPTRPVRPPDTTTDAGPGTDSAPPDPSCSGPDGCFKCEPAKPVEFLNACTDRTCVPFDNKARLPLFEDGKPLPAVP